ncbi:hypothetical protein EV195_102304 [Tenacibaculum skagerrakense]|uniref:Uncharacterized protein n=2 Tax=Tenacibaculum skagerrakense TaxID=186571 RepID=A0A4R2NY14_9FLAO|nr:hypothetical protein EV195_102304 [Tenacibaculum skagerrakense]
MIKLQPELFMNLQKPMNYTIKKGRNSSTILFISTGIFLVISFSYQLLNYLKTNDFITSFPGDWDKPLGILVGIFLLIRSQRFKNQRKGLFIKLNKNELTFRTKESETTQKINTNEIDKAYASEDNVILKTNSHKKITIDLSSIKSEKEMKAIRKMIIVSINNQ